MDDCRAIVAPATGVNGSVLQSSPGAHSWTVTFRLTVRFTDTEPIDTDAAVSGAMVTVLVEVNTPEPEIRNVYRPGRTDGRL